MYVDDIVVIWDDNAAIMELKQYLVKVFVIIEGG